MFIVMFSLMKSGTTTFCASARQMLIIADDTYPLRYPEYVV